MLEGLLFESVIIIVLILANGFFAASEIAMVSARKGRLLQRAERGEQGAAAALELAEHPNQFLSTVQVGISLIGTFAAAFGGASIARVLESRLALSPLIAPYASSIALGVVVVVITYLSLIIGELVPKRLALQNAEGIAAFVAPTMRLLARLVNPVVNFLTLSTELVLRLLGRHDVEEEPITEEDIMALVREGITEGTVEEAEENFITNVFTFTDRTVRSVMTPRMQIVAVEINTPIPELIQLLTKSGHSRIPIYEDSLDQVVGILYVKELLQTWGETEPPDLQSLLRPPFYVLESQRAGVAFQQLRHNRITLALVLDEYGQVAGLVTIEDMLEELVGDITDEYDPMTEMVVRREDGSYLVDGLLSTNDLQAEVSIPQLDELAREYSFDTTAGLMLALLGRVPATGDKVRWQDYVFEVMDMDELRIDKILITPPHIRPQASDRTHGILASRAVVPLPNAGKKRSQARGER